MKRRIYYYFFVFLIAFIPAMAEGVSGSGAPGLFAWVAYWDLRETRSELERFVSSGGTLSFFAAYYDEYNMLFIPAEITAAYSGVKTAWPDKPAYITVVNDVLYSDGSTSEKSKELVEELLRTTDTMRWQAAVIASMAQEYGYAGVDMDYENLYGSAKLWDKYAKFLGILQKELESRGLGLRVILEPRALDKAKWPKNLTYSVMLYNLYGNHSGPGPKASDEFIRTTLAKAKKYLGKNVNAALATGGYVWIEGMGVESVTEKEALARLRDTYVVPRRDPNSMALFARLSGWEGMWFADGVTLQHWAEISREEGVDSFSIWRLGGNDPASVERFSTLAP
jgi:spore germination protein YaaH